MMPVPTHLKDCVVPDNRKKNEEPLEGDVRCPCGGEIFELHYPGKTHKHGGEIVPCVAQIKRKFFFLIRAKCSACKKQHLLIDQDFHGWEGFVCHDQKQAALPRPPLVPWKCAKCGGVKHRARVMIESQGKADFVEETDGEIDAKRWPDAFECFAMSIECAACELETPEWVALETM